MKLHFGTKPVKAWIDGSDWQENFPSFNNLSDREKVEIRKSLEQAASGIFL